MAPLQWKWSSLSEGIGNTAGLRGSIKPLGYQSTANPFLFSLVQQENDCGIPYQGSKLAQNSASLGKGGLEGYVRFGGLLY